jgi:AmpD protein
MDTKNTGRVFDFIDNTVDGADKRPRPVVAYKDVNGRTLYKPDSWSAIVIHHTGLPDRWVEGESFWKVLHQSIVGWLSLKDSTYVSAHFQIGRRGEITQIVNPDLYVSFHAGVSSFWNPLRRQWTKGVNDFAVGIELLGDGNLVAYSDAQYDALAKLCNALMIRYQTIQPHCITGHECVSPGRKTDPGVLFEWRRFFKNLYQQY